LLGCGDFLDSSESFGASGLLVMIDVPCTVGTFHTKGWSKIFWLIFLLFWVKIVVLIPKWVLKISCVAIAP
jgi:hypothetical protein